MVNQKKGIYIVIALLSILAIIFSIIILVQKTTDSAAINNICSAVSPQSQCSVVQHSAYGRIFGIDNPWYGIFGFIIMTFLSITEYYSHHRFKKYSVIIGSIMAGMLASWFLYVQRYILNAYCIFCIFVDIISLTLLGIAVYLIINQINNRKTARS
jgi:uncharacterized membrane protein